MGLGRSGISRRTLKVFIKKHIAKNNALRQALEKKVDALLDQIFRRASLADARDPAQCAGYKAHSEIQFSPEGENLKDCCP